MNGKAFKKHYLNRHRNGLDPVGPLLAISLLGVVAYPLLEKEELRDFLDLNGFLIVVGGCVIGSLFQYSILSLCESIVLVAKSFVLSPQRVLKREIAVLDHALLNDSPLGDLAEGEEINGDLVNDIVYLSRSGLSPDETENFICLRIERDQAARSTCAQWLQKLSLLAPAFGLFGTVLGLVGLLRALNDPSQIGASMALALMTTAYGSGLSSLVFTPLAGRLAHHNELVISRHQEFFRKMQLVLKRDDAKLIPQAYGRVSGL